MADLIQQLLKAEQENFARSEKFLGSTALLVGDLDALYDRLVATVAKEEPKQSDDAYRAFLSVLHLHSVCRRQLLMGALTLFRGHQSDAVIHLRLAIDAVASAWRIGNHHEMSTVWLSSALSDTAYKEYRKLFHPTKLYPKKNESDYHQDLDAMYQNYAMFSKIVHSSVYATAGRTTLTDENGALGISLHLCDLVDGRASVTGLFMTLDNHRRAITLLGESFRKCGARVNSSWYDDCVSVYERQERHREKWKPIVKSYIEHLDGLAAANERRRPKGI